MRHDREEPEDDFATSMGAPARELNDDEDDDFMPPRLEPARMLMGFAPPSPPARGRRGR